MASVHPRVMAGGRTAYRLRYRIDGRLQSLTFDDQAAAEHWAGVFDAAGPAAALRLLDEAIAADEPASPPAPTVRDMVEDHIASRTGITDGTRADYRTEAARDIYPTLGDLPLTALDPPNGVDVVAHWVNYLTSGHRPGGPLSGKTIANRHGLLSAACERAVARRQLLANPCRGMRLPEPNPEPMIFLTRQQWWLIHDALPPYWQPFATFLVSTGLRFSEATALQVRDVDLAAGQLRVVRAWKHHRGAAPALGGPKSRAGRRTVPFGPPLARVITPWVDGRPAEALVFPTRRGGPLLNNTFHSRIWGPAMAAAGARGLAVRPRPHDLRHTFASWALASGRVNIFMLAKIMGHDDPKVTHNRYGHLMPQSMDAVAAAAAALLER